MFNEIFKVPAPQNEPIYGYAPNSPERKELETVLQDMLKNPVEVPLLIGSQEVKTGKLAPMRCPHDHQQILGHYPQGDIAHTHQAIDAANAAKKDWSRMPWDSRAII
ncbi:1-pyrroline-5-carboxylate dehydrogenase, partial [bacterium]|nr:1-pyrroline-5-carboxylate dehydrogenase [bacterium]